MIALPSMLLIAILAVQSFIGAAILSRPWMRRVALGLGVFEVAMLIVLALAVGGYA